MYSTTTLYEVPNNVTVYHLTMIIRISAPGAGLLLYVEIPMDRRPLKRKNLRNCKGAYLNQAVNAKNLKIEDIIDCR